MKIKVVTIWSGNIFLPKNKKRPNKFGRFTYRYNLKIDRPLKLPYNSKVLEEYDFAKEWILQIRKLRQKYNMSSKDMIFLNNPNPEMVSYLPKSFLKYVNVEFKPCEISGFKVDLLINKEIFSFILPKECEIDIVKEKEKLKTELKRLENFLESVNMKLNNQQFIEKAKPEIIQNEKNKKRDTELKINLIKEELQN